MTKSFRNSQVANITQSFNGFKNRIINGSFNVNQRQDPYVNNQSKYPIDRVFVETINSSVYCDIDNYYSLNEGTLVDNPDPFQDGSQIAGYRFNNNLNDMNGNYNAQMKDSNGNDVTPTYTTCKRGYAVKFDGNSYIDTGISSFNSEVTVSFWLKQGPLDTSTGHCILIFSKDDENTLSLWQTGSAGKMILTCNNTESFQPFSYYLEDNAWHHIVLSSAGYIYLDGKKIFEFPAVDLSVVNKSLLIGADRDPNAVNNFIQDGTELGLFRVFNRRLFEDEIISLYLEDRKYLYKRHYKCEVITKDKGALINPYVYKFEGQDISDIVKGDMVLSFDFKSSVNGTYNIKLVTECLDGTNEIFETTFDYDSMDFERVVIKIPKGTFTKDIVSNEELGATLYIANNSEDIVDVNDIIRLANVQLEANILATDFEEVPYNVELQRCMRYYEKMYVDLRLYSDNSFFPMTVYPFMVEKRINPSISAVDLVKTNIDSLNFSTNETSSNKRRLILNMNPTNSGAVRYSGIVICDAEL